MDARRALRLQNGFVIRVQAHRLLRRTRQYMFQIFQQGLVSITDDVSVVLGQRNFVRCQTRQQLFDGFGDDRHAIDIHHLQRAVGLMQMGLGMVQRG